MVPIRKLLRKYNNRVLSLVVFYENRKNMIFKVLISVVYCTMHNYLFDGYLCCPQTKIHVANKLFKTRPTMIFQGLSFQKYY